MSSEETQEPAPDFEQSIARLEAIVSRMNDPKTGLEEMIALVEEGLGLVRSSRELLAKAELRIRALEGADADDEAAGGASRTDNGFSFC